MGRERERRERGKECEGNKGGKWDKRVCLCVMQRCKLLCIQTILPKVMRPTRAVGGMRLSDS